MIQQETGDLIHGNGQCLVLRIAVSAGGDHREGDALAVVCRRQFQGMPVAAGEQFFLPVGASVPDGPDRVDHIAGRQAVPFGDLCFPGIAAAECAAFLEKFRPGRPVNGAVHAPAAQQGPVGRVYDRVHVHFGDVIPHHFKRHIFHTPLFDFIRAGSVSATGVFH